jgi:hypothetical protein
MTLRDKVCAQLVEHMLALDLKTRAEVEKVADRILALVADDRQELEEALRSYGQHDKNCAYFIRPTYKCDCGFVAALRKEGNNG